MGKMDEMILVAPRARVFQNETLAFNGVNSEEKTISTIMKEIEEHLSRCEEAMQKKILTSNSRYLMS